MNIFMRFKKYIAYKDDGCWLWTGYRNEDGYGRFRVGKKLWNAHRLSYSLFIGKIPDEIQVLHHCDNPPCVNPDHLFLGTQIDNINDMVRKNRQRSVKGEKHHLAKLDWPKAYEIKWLSAMGYSTRKLARMYNVARSNIQFVAANKTWIMECHD